MTFFLSCFLLPPLRTVRFAVGSLHEHITPTSFSLSSTDCGMCCRQRCVWSLHHRNTHDHRTALGVRLLCLQSVDAYGLWSPLPSYNTLISPSSRLLRFAAALRTSLYPTTTSLLTLATIPWPPMLTADNLVLPGRAASMHCYGLMQRPRILGVLMRYRLLHWMTTDELLFGTSADCTTMLIVLTTRVSEIGP